MSFLKTLPADAVLLHVFRAYPETSVPLLAFHETLLRGPSPLSVAKRELIAAYVSGLNACAHCHGVHEATAREFGVAADLLAVLLTDLERAPVAEKLKPILRYVGKLTQSPARMTQADAVFAAGWTGRALHDTGYSRLL
ncbi:MAG: carboxymuconolactone decarboxylase family protein [Pseudomonadota bacterium]